MIETIFSDLLNFLKNGDNVLLVILTIASAITSYVLGKRKNKAEAGKLDAEAGKTDVEASDIIVGSAKKLIDYYDELIKVERTRIKELEDGQTKLEYRISFQASMIDSLNTSVAELTAAKKIKEVLEVELEKKLQETMYLNESLKTKVDNLNEYVKALRNSIDKLMDIVIKDHPELVKSIKNVLVEYENKHG